MKRIKHIILISLVLFSAGCKDDDKLIFESVTDQTGTAGGLRTINLISPSIDLNDIANSEFSVEVEEWDDQDGGLLESVDVFVQFQDFTPENGTNNKPEVLVLNVPASNFQVSESSGLPRTVISVAAEDAVGLLGLDASSEIDGGDVFRFRLALNLTDGSVFSSNNLEGNLTGVFFNSPFSYPANVVCNLDPTLFAGTYQMEFVSGSGGFGPSLGDQQVTIVANSGTQRSTQVTWLPAGGPQTLTFDLICGKINVPLYSTGLACVAGAGAITWQTTGEQATFDPTDDSEFFVRYNDFVNDGGCGVPSYEVVLRFVKI
tara:strand:+ start:3545 stop:4495 length:951 start_codon:yes stop_codon:yes gene_type:complete